MFDVLIGYESSGVMRQAFRKLGVNAYSCDLQPSDDNSPYHLQCDIWEVTNDTRWKFGMFHPTCTYLTNSASWAFKDGPYHQRVKPETLVGKARRDARTTALKDVEKLMKLPYSWIIENPRGFIGSMLKKATQTIQPYEFGDDASKSTCLWLSDDLEPIYKIPSERFDGRIVNGVERWSNQTDSGQNRLAPGKDRWKIRSKTYQGIANAIAFQVTGQLYKKTFDTLVK